MKLNVLHLIGSFTQGGSERQAVQLVRLLSESKRYQVHVACLDARGVLRQELDLWGPDRVAEFSLNNFYDHRMVAQLARFAMYVREHNIHIVQTHDFYTNVFGMLGAALGRTPMRVAARRETTGTRTRPQKHAERISYLLANSVVANAEAVRRQLVKDGVPAVKTVVIHNGLDIARLVPTHGLRLEDRFDLLGLPRSLAGRPVVTMVANMRQEVKDHSTLLAAARRVKEAVPDVAFVLAGEGELAEGIRARAAGLETSVFLTGRCERVADLLASSSVGVLTSRAEGFANAILEYMGAGLPVVATDVGGASEAVVEDETGYLVAAGDVNLLATRLTCLLRDPLQAAKMGERGRVRVVELFSCATQLRRTEQLYEVLLSRSGLQAKTSQR